jgi:leucyl-tRNA synthetase
VVILAPLAPHITEELWHQLGNKKSVHLESWPQFDPELIKEETITLIIQINGKVRDRMEAEAGLSRERAEKLALGRKKIKDRLKNRKVKDVIFVPDKIVNIVT